MEEIIGILEETPWWVYVVFAYIVTMGIKALKARTVSIKKLILLPAFFTIWGFIGMQWILFTALSWSLSLAVGGVLGWFSVHNWKIRYDRGRGTLHLPGSWTSLGLALAFFSVKYAFGFYHATHAEISTSIYIAESASSGLITGMFIGRFVYFWKKYEQI